MISTNFKRPASPFIRVDLWKLNTKISWLKGHIHGPDETAEINIIRHVVTFGPFCHALLWAQNWFRYNVIFLPFPLTFFNHFKVAFAKLRLKSFTSLRVWKC